MEIRNIILTRFYIRTQSIFTSTDSLRKML